MSFDFKFAPLADTDAVIEPIDREKQIDAAALVDAAARLDSQLILRADLSFIHYRNESGSTDLTLCAKSIKGPHAADPLAVSCVYCWDILAERRLVPRTNEMVKLRREILTPTLAQEIIAGVQNGTPPETCAALHGIGKRQLYTWLAVGSRLLESDAVYFTKDEMELIEFTREMRRAVATHEVQLTANIAEAGKIPKHWAANSWLLEKHFPEKYSKKLEITSVGTENQSNSENDLDYSHLSDEELIQLDNLTRKAKLRKVIDVASVSKSPVQESE